MDNFKKACKVAHKQIKKSNLKYKKGFKTIKDLGESWCFVPEYIGASEGNPVIANLLLLIVKKDTLDFSWEDFINIRKQFKEAINIETPKKYAIK